MKKLIVPLISALFLSLLVSCTSLLGGGSGDASAMKGLGLYNEGNYEEAIDLLNDAVEKGTEEYKLSEVYSAIGGCYLELGDYEEAIDTYKKSLDEDSSSVSGWVNLGVAYRQNGDLEGAEECYTKALDIDPEYAELRSSLGTLYIIKNEPEKAIAEFDKAIELDPSLAVAHGNAAMAYAMTGDFERAEELLKQSKVLGYENADEIQNRIDMLKE